MATSDPWDFEEARTHTNSDSNRGSCSHMPAFICLCAVQRANPRQKEE